MEQIRPTQSRRKSEEVEEPMDSEIPIQPPPYHEIDPLTSQREISSYGSLPEYAQPSAPPMMTDNGDGLTRSQKIRQQDKDLAEINRRISNNPPDYENINAAYSIFDRHFGNIFERGSFFRKVYILLGTQLFFFCGLCVLFVAIPHLRKIFRHNIFDRLFLTSFFGFPLIIALLILFLFESFRRRYAKFSIFLLTSCLAFLLSYVLTMDDCYQMMYQMFGMDMAVFFSAGISWLVPRFCMRSLKEAAALPTLMVLYNLALPHLFQNASLTRSWHYGAGSTALVSYLAYNTVSVFNNEKLAIQKDEYFFAASSLYCNFDLFRSVSHLFRRRPNSSSSYESI